MGRIPAGADRGGSLRPGTVQDLSPAPAAPSGPLEQHKSIMENTQSCTSAGQTVKN